MIKLVSVKVWQWGSDNYEVERCIKNSELFLWSTLIKTKERHSVLTCEAYGLSSHHQKEKPPKMSILPMIWHGILEVRRITPFTELPRFSIFLSSESSFLALFIFSLEHVPKVSFIYSCYNLLLICTNKGKTTLGLIF